MESVYLLEAKYVKDFSVFLKFNTGESGVVDLSDVIHKYSAATSLRTSDSFAKFYLDSWPTLVWDCGFDIAPESLYYRLEGQPQKKHSTNRQPT